MAQVQPDVVVNAAAYTAVDQAESEPDLAHQINAAFPAHLAKRCQQNGALLVHYSTDYVFAGDASKPYREDMQTQPTGVYGATKEAGEVAIRNACAHHLIFRTAWVYGARGKNFLLTMLRLAAEKDQLSVVADQTGSPTWSRQIAEASAQVIARYWRDRQNGNADLAGTYHLTSAGQTSWHAFAESIFEQAVALGLIENAPKVDAIPTSAYPTPAQRPAFSVLDGQKLLDAFAIQLPDWQTSLRLCLEDLRG